jgi:hypothetical protein
MKLLRASTTAINGKIVSATLQEADGFTLVNGVSVEVWRDVCPLHVDANGTISLTSEAQTVITEEMDRERKESNTYVTDTRTNETDAH